MGNKFVGGNPTQYGEICARAMEPVSSGPRCHLPQLDKRSAQIVSTLQLTAHREMQANHNLTRLAAGGTPRLLPRTLQSKSFQLSGSHPMENDIGLRGRGRITSALWRHEPRPRLPTAPPTFSVTGRHGPLLSSTL